MKSMKSSILNHLNGLGSVPARLLVTGMGFALLSFGSACSKSQFRAGKVATTETVPESAPATSPVPLSPTEEPKSLDQKPKVLSSTTELKSEDGEVNADLDDETPEPTENDKEVVSQDIPVNQQISWENAARNTLIDALLNSGTKNSTTTPVVKSSPKPAEPVCTNVSNTVTTTKPLDIVFSVDVSTSMGPYINVVKNNVIEFANVLARKGIDVNFAAVGFVDRPVVSIGFTDVARFQGQISQWNPLDLGNTDFQEGGQRNIEHALWMLLNEARPSASKVLVHISDAVIFAGDDHNDFSTSKLGAVFANAKASLGAFQFFDSVPSQNGLIGAGLSRTTASFSPLSQMKAFRADASGLPGSSLSFPFSGSTLTQDLPNLIESKVETVRVCK